MAQRKLCEIAKEIREDAHNWAGHKVSPYAQPYLDAMAQLESVNDTYICDSAKSIVLYFLANAQTWRGEKARAIKAELKNITK